MLVLGLDQRFPAKHDNEMLSLPYMTLSLFPRKENHLVYIITYFPGMIFMVKWFGHLLSNNVFDIRFHGFIVCFLYVQFDMI